MQFCIGDKVRHGMHVGTVTDVGTVLIQVKTTIGPSRMVCPWELVKLRASHEDLGSDSKRDWNTKQAVIAVRNVQETNLAWALIEAANAHLHARQRNHVFVAIGAGDTFAAISLLLKLIGAMQILLPPHLVQQCAAWLDTYALHEEHEHLRSLIEGFSMSDPVQASTPISRLPTTPPPGALLRTSGTSRPPTTATPTRPRSQLNAGPETRRRVTA
jgi:hypothetical protein